MKRILLLCITAWIVLGCVACSGVTPTAVYIEPEATPVSDPDTAAPSPSPSEGATPEPEGQPATVRVDAVGVILRLANRDENVNVSGERDGYYIIGADGTDALVEKCYVRLDCDAPYEPWTGYVKADTPVFGTAYLDGEALFSLPLNTKVTVLDAPGSAFLISWENNSGYVSGANVMKQPAGGSGGGGGGSSDGGDIQLSADSAYGGRYARLFARTGTVSALLPDTAENSFPCTGTVLADRTEIYLVILASGDPVRVMDADENRYQVLTDAGIGTVPKRLIRLASEAPYAEWDGFSDNDASFFSDYRTLCEIDRLKRNTALRVIDDLGDCYLVEAEGRIGYVRKNQAGSEEYAAPSGGNGGGQEWTDPVL